MSTPEPVIVVVDNDFEKRYYYSARRATDGILGWRIHPDNPAVLKGQAEAGKALVYRLDIEASQTLEREVEKVRQSVGNNYDPRTGRYFKSVLDKVRTIIQNCTGIKEK